MSIYTMEQWKKDKEFKAEAGQEITEEVYNQMLNSETLYNSFKSID